MKTLVLNCGSSSLKYQLIDAVNDTLIAKGMVEKIGTTKAVLIHTPALKNTVRETTEILNHAKALRLVLFTLTDKVRGVISNISEIQMVGHRVVHGGEKFSESVEINEEVIAQIEECAKFAPLHNPPNLTGIRACMDVIGSNIKQFAVFDTAFHQNIPEKAYLYGLPYSVYERFGIRRYGFHGTSHCFVSESAASYLKKDLSSIKLITCHLGNGSSISAVNKGISVDTSMGFTPLEGVIMGTRCGDIDPAIVTYLMDKENLTTKEADSLMNKSSGLMGLTKTTNDMREIEEEASEGSKQHRLAFDMFCYRIKKYIGSYYAVLNGIDALVFTAGIGENSFNVRKSVCEELEAFGIEIDHEKNEKNEILISKGKTPVLVIPTNEELAIAKESYRVLSENQEEDAINAVEQKFKHEMERLSDSDKAHIAIIWSANQDLTYDDLQAEIEDKKGIKISLNTLERVLEIMDLKKPNQGEESESSY